MATHLSPENLDRDRGPLAPVDALSLCGLRDSVDVCDLARLCVRAEDVDRLAKLLCLQHDALHHLRVCIHVENGEIRGLVRLVLEELLERVAGLAARAPSQLNDHVSGVKEEEKLTALFAAASLSLMCLSNAFRTAPRRSRSSFFLRSEMSV